MRENVYILTFGSQFFSTITRVGTLRLSVLLPACCCWNTQQQTRYHAFVRTSYTLVVYPQSNELSSATFLFHIPEGACSLLTASDVPRISVLSLPWHGSRRRVGTINGPNSARCTDHATHVMVLLSNVLGTRHGQVEETWVRGSNHLKTRSP